MNFSSQFDTLHEQAIQASGGLTDFGDTEYVTPMKILLSDYDNNAKLGEIGCQMIAGNIVGLLTARLREEHQFKLYPKLANGKILKPLIIVGMARTGTTVLHRLLAQDPDNQGLPLWLTSDPMPRPPTETWGNYDSFNQLQQGLEQLYQLIPDFKRLHPQHPAALDECSFLLTHSFCSTSLDVTATVPEYRKWLYQSDAHVAYQRYRKILALISGGSQRRWILKCPTHMWNLPTLLDTFPDACVVMPHRDPSTTVTSITSLLHMLRKLHEPTLDTREFGTEQLDRWTGALKKAEADRATIDPARLYDIHFDDIKQDPMGSIERIYSHFDIPLTETATTLFQQQVRTNPNGGHASHLYKPEDFGLRAELIRDLAGDYYQRYLRIEENRLSA